MKNFLTLAVLIALIAGCTKSPSAKPEAPAKPTLILGTNAGYPPYESVSASGQVEGFDIDVANAIAQKLGRTLVIKDMSFDALILALKQDKFDLIMSGISITPARAKEISLIPYQGESMKSFALVFWGKIPPAVKSIEDIKSFDNQTVTVQAGTVMEDYLRKVAGITSKPLDSTPELIMDIKHNKSVAALLEPHIADEVMSKHPELKRLEHPLPEAEWVLGNGIGIKKENAALYNQVKATVESLKKEGVIQTLEKKWFKGKAS